MRHTSPRVLFLVTLSLLLAGQATAAPVEPVRPGPVRARAEVTGDGWVRVPAAQLKAAQLDPTKTQVTRGGISIPALADADDLVFLALDTAGPYSRVAVFVLREGTPPSPAAASLQASDKPLAEPATTIDRRRFAPDNFLGPLAASRRAVYGGRVPVWFAGMIDPQTRTTFELMPIRGEPTGTTHLAVQLFGTHKGKVALRATWGDQDLGVSTDRSAAGGTVLAWTLPAEVATSSGRLVLQDVSPKPPRAPRNDVSSGRGQLWIDVIDLSGSVAVPPTVGASSFAELDMEAGATFAFDDAPRFAVMVDHQGVAKGAVHKWATAGTVTTAHVGRLCVGPATRTATVTTVREHKHPMVTAGDAEHVIIATPPLVEAGKRLAAHRAATGIPSAVVPVLDVYDTYGQGEQSPRAIRQFVLALMQRGRAKLKYVLLAGDATFDRTDIEDLVTIPAPMARTKYNGATASDRLYTKPVDGGMLGGPALGRLPFRTAKPMQDFVDRLIRYETEKRPDLTRNMLRFITSEGRFGAMVDLMLERAFRKVLSEELDPAYDIEVTFASLKSAFLWPPPHFNDKVISGLNDGCLFLTYVGHGFAQGFDTLRVKGQYFPILNMEHVDRIDVKGTPPTLFVLACTTAMFDGRKEAIGEAIMKRTDGPIAFWGSTRICHPAANTLLGHALALYMTQEGAKSRLGDIIAKAADYAIKPDPRAGATTRAVLSLGVGMAIMGEETSAKELAEQASEMYVLLGDPATQLAVPKHDIRVAAQRSEDKQVEVAVAAALPEGSKVEIRVEYPRNYDAIKPTPIADPLDPAGFDTIRSNHAAMNNRLIAKAEAVLVNGAARLVIDTGGYKAGWVVKVIAITKTDVHHGATILK